MGGKSNSSQSTASSNSNTNIVNDGDYAGVTGDIALDESQHTVEDSNNTDNSIENDIDNSIENDGDYAGNNGNITITDGGAVNAGFAFGTAALDEAFDFGDKALDKVDKIADSAFDSTKEQTAAFSKSLEAMLKSTTSAQQSMSSTAAKANTEDKALIAQLAQSTSLAGQDLVAKSSEKMTMYMALALGIGFVAIIFFGRRK